MAAAAAAAAAAVGSKEEAEAYRKRSDNILKEYLISPELVVLENKVGSGSFGDVYKGKCLGDHPAAIKTMKEVTEASALAFRREILLTASLRAPNVVHFVGACWGKELTCLILEWMPHGSLQTMLDLDGEQPPPAAAEALSRALGEDVAGAAAASAAASAARKAERLLHWGEPLLRLATDIARGMAYLHNRRLVRPLLQRAKNLIGRLNACPESGVVIDEILLQRCSFLHHKTAGTSTRKTAA